MTVIPHHHNALEISVTLTIWVGHVYLLADTHSPEPGSAHLVLPNYKDSVSSMAQHSSSSEDTWLPRELGGGRAALKEWGCVLPPDKRRSGEKAHKRAPPEELQNTMQGPGCRGRAGSFSPEHSVNDSCYWLWREWTLATLTSRSSSAPGGIFS